MVLVPNDFVMGINFSNDFQSQPVDPADAADQLTPLVGMAKTFSWIRQRSGCFAWLSAHQTICFTILRTIK